MKNKKPKKILSILIGTMLLLMITATTPITPTNQNNQNLVTAQETLTVDPNDDSNHDNITSALDNATKGDTIEVEPGTYEENITVDIPELIIEGPNAGIPGDSDDRSGEEATIEGKIKIFAANVTVKGFTISPTTTFTADIKPAAAIFVNSTDTLVENNIITGVHGDSSDSYFSVHGIQVFKQEAPRIENIEISNNLIRDIRSNSSTDKFGGAVGIKVQNQLEDILVKDNTVRDIHSAGWTYGIVSTPSSLNTVQPKNISIRKNTISSINDGSEYNVSDNTGEAPYPGVAVGLDTESGDPESSTPANASEVEVHYNNLIAPIGVQNKDQDAALDATHNWWNTTTKSEIKGKISGDVNYTPWFDARYPEGEPVNIKVPEHYDSIQEAVNVAEEGDTIEVAAGTYTGTMNISGINNLTIKGAGQSQTILKPSTVLSWGSATNFDERTSSIRVVDSEDVVLKEMNIDFNNVDDTAESGLVFWDSTGRIENNKIEGMSNPDSVVDLTSYFGTSDPDETPYTRDNRAEIVIRNNVFNETGRIGVNVEDFMKATVEKNNFTTTDAGYAIEIGSESTGVIRNNKIHGYKHAFSSGSNSAGIYIENAYAYGYPNAYPDSELRKEVLVEENEIYDSYRAIWVGQTWNSTSGNVSIHAQVRNNNIHDNENAGITVTDENSDEGSSVNVNAKDNNVKNNGKYGYHILTKSDGSSEGDGNITVEIDGDTIKGHSVGINITDSGEPGNYDISVENTEFTDNQIQVNDESEVLDIQATLDNNIFNRAVVVNSSENLLLPAIWSNTQDAINDASEGDTIEVSSGTYEEDININTEGIRIIGNDAVIESQTGPAVQVNSKDIVLSGFEITGGAGEGESGQGIDVNGDSYETDNVTLKNLVVKDNDGKGLVVDYSNNTIIKNVTAENNYGEDWDSPEDAWENGDSTDGITIWYSNNTELINVTSKDNGDNGIYINGNNTYLENINVHNNGDEGLDISNERIDGGRAEITDLNATNNQAQAIEIEGNGAGTEINIENAVLGESPIGLNILENNEATISSNNLTFRENTEFQVKDVSNKLDLKEVLNNNTFIPESVVVDNTIVPEEEVNITNVDQNTGYETIKVAIDAANEGETIEVDSGSYGSFNIKTDGLTLKGSGMDETTIQGQNHVDATGVTVRDLELDANGGNSWVVESDAEINDLRVENVKTVDNSIGIEIRAGENSPDEADGLHIENFQVENNTVKGIYLERANNAVLKDIKIDGIRYTGNENPPSNGIDINLKYNDYENITIKDTVVRGVERDDFGDDPTWNSAMCIKARDDGGYSEPPATLDQVTIENITIENSVTGLRFGEPGVDYSGEPEGPTDVTIVDSTFQNNDHYHIEDLSNSVDLGTVKEENTFDKAVSSNTGIYSSIQTAINTASSGDTIEVEAGTYNEEVTIDKSITLTGSDGSSSGTILNGTGSGTGIIIAESNISVENLQIKNYANGISIDGSYSNITFEDVSSIENSVRGMEIHNNADLQDLMLKNVSFSNNSGDGLRAATESSIDGFTVMNSHFDNNLGEDNSGFEIYQSESHPGSLKDVLIKDTTFNNNGQKGIYTEKLSNATLDNITIDGVMSETNEWNAGIDINLKYKDYKNITISDTTVTNVLMGGQDNGQIPVGITIKARADPSSYNDPAASLTGDVILENLTITNNPSGIRFGETGKSEFGLSVDPEVKKSNIENNDNFGLINENDNITVDAEYNWWGHKSGPGGEGPGQGDNVTDNVDYTPWLNDKYPDGEPRPVDHIEISPSNDQTITAGKAIDFNAEAYDENDKLINDLDAVDFDWVNTDDSGVFDKTTAGEYVVNATYGEVTSDTVTVTVEPASGDHIEITPTDPTITTGETIDFNASAYDPDNNLITEDDTNFTWENATEGLFDKIKYGEYNVTATYDGVISPISTVTVEPHILEINTEGIGTTTLEEGTHKFSDGEEVKLTPTPGENYYFDGWTGDITQEEEEITLTMDGDKEITANFEAESETIFKFNTTIIGEDELEVGKRETASYNISITNNANLDTYNLTAISPRSDATLEDETITLEPGQTKTTTLNVSSNTTGTYDVSVSIVSSNSSKVDTVTTTTNVEGYGLTITPDTTSTTVRPPNEGSYNLTIKNTGNVEDRYSVEILTDDALNIPEEEFEVGPIDPSQTESFEVGLPGSVGDFEATVNISSINGDKRTSETLELNVEEQDDPNVALSIDPVTQKVERNGEPTYTVKVKNTGNIEDTYTLSTSSEATTSLGTNSMTLGSGESETTTLTVSEVDEIKNYATVVEVESDNYDVDSTRPVFTQVVESVDIRAVPGSQTTTQGNASTYTINVRNTGIKSHEYNISVPTKSLDTTAELSETSINLEPGQTGETILTLNNERELDPDESRRIEATIQASVDEEPIKSDSTSVSALYTKEKVYGVSISSEMTEQSIKEDGTATYLLEVQNLGNTKDTIQLSTTEGELETKSVDLSAAGTLGDTKVIKLEHSPDSSEEIEVTATSGNDDSVKDFLSLSTRIAQVQEDGVTNSDVDGVSTVTDSNVTSSTIINSYINNSSVVNSQITNSKLINTTVRESDLTNARIENGLVENNLIQYGTVTVEGTEYEVTKEDKPITKEELVSTDKLENNIGGATGEETEIPAENTKVSINIQNEENYIGGSLTSQRSEVSPKDVEEVTDSIGYIRLLPSANIEQSADYIMINMTYEETELPEDVNEENLSINWYNNETDEWVQLKGEGDPEFCNGITRNTEENYILANVTHFSTYSIGQDTPEEPEEEPEKDDESISTGGGGGGISTSSGGQPVRSVYLTGTNPSRSLSSVKGGEMISVSVEPAAEDHSLIGFNSTAEEFLGSVSVQLQHLGRETDKVPEVENAFSYTEINLEGAQNDQISNNTLTFRVQKSWVEEMDAEVENVVVKRYNEEWETLETEYLDETEEYYRFKAESPGLSIFAVTVEIPEIITETAIDQGIYQKILDKTTIDKELVLGKSAAPEVDATFTTDTMNYEGETYTSEWKQKDYALIQFEDGTIEMLGTHRYGTRAASMYYREEKPTTTTILKWVDENNDNEVQYDELEVIE